MPRHRAMCPEECQVRYTEAGPIGLTEMPGGSEGSSRSSAYMHISQSFKNPIEWAEGERTSIMMFATLTSRWRMPAFSQASLRPTATSKYG